MKSIFHALTYELPRAFPYAGLALLSLVAIVLTGCGALRFPEPTPEPTGSPIPVPTPTLAAILLTPVPTSTPLPDSSASSVSPTPTFALPLPEPTCLATPMWGLGDVWRNEAVRTRLGCPVGEQMGIEGEELYFQNGHALWCPSAGLIYVLFYHRQAEGWGAFADTFQPTDPETDPTIVEPTPMSGPGGRLYSQPAGRFGKLWRANAWLREELGWALVPYDGKGHALRRIRFNGAVQDFERGVLLWNGDVCFVLRTDDMSWDMY